jgi:hypothetical protein
VKVVRPSSHVTMPPSGLSSSRSQARSWSCSSAITAKEGTDEGTKALHQSKSKGRCHDGEMSLDEHHCRVTHLADGEARLEEAPDLRRRDGDRQ